MKSWNLGGPVEAFTCAFLPLKLCCHVHVPSFSMFCLHCFASSAVGIHATTFAPVSTHLTTPRRTVADGADSAAVCRVEVCAAARSTNLLLWRRRMGWGIGGKWPEKDGREEEVEEGRQI